MKIRNGFVSNSSSSSFLVKVKDLWKDKDKLLISKEEIEKLREFGFKWTTAVNSLRLLLANNNGYIKSDNKKYRDELGFIITCNQHEVLYFLVSNNIPFRASCQYGNETWMYDRDSDVIYEFQNFGHYMEMYDDARSFSKRYCDRVKAGKKHDRKKWLQEMKEEIEDIERHEIENDKYNAMIDKIEKTRCYLCGRFSKNMREFSYDVPGICKDTVKVCPKCSIKKRKIKDKFISNA